MRVRGAHRTASLGTPCMHTRTCSFSPNHYNRTQPSTLIPGGLFRTQDTDYTLSEFPIFMLIGLVCGFFGAGFNYLSLRLTRWRQKRLTSKRSRLVEVLAVAAATALICCMLPLGLSCDAPYTPAPETKAECKPPPNNPLQLQIHSYVCGPGGDQSSLVNLLLSSHESSIKLLFHSPSNIHGDHGLGVPVCIFTFLAYTMLGICEQYRACPVARAP
jgi:hypothetical protein